MAGAASPEPQSPPPPAPPGRRTSPGLRVRLLLAVLAIAGTTVLVSLLAWATFNRTAESLDHITGQDIPVIVELSRLAQRSHTLIAGAAAMVFSDDGATLESESARVARAEAAFLIVLRRVQDKLGDLPALRKVSEVSGRMSANLLILRSAMEHRWKAAGQQARLLEQLDVLHQEYRLLVGRPVAEDARYAALLTELNRLLVTLGTLREATTPAAARSLRKRIDGAFAAVERLVDGPAPVLPAAPEQGLRTLLVQARRLARGESSLPALRERELIARDVAAARLDDLHVQAAELDVAMAALGEAAETEIAEERTRAVDGLERSGTVLLLVAAVAVLGAAAIGWLYVGRSVVRRISRLNQSMRAIAAGDLDHPIPVDGADEVTDMARALTTFRDAMADVAHYARHDTLTGLANRRVLDEAVARHVAAGRVGAVLYLNLDGFKDINDTFGHATGDRVLQAVSGRLARRARPEDTVARLGGDDFVLVAPDIAEPETLANHAETLKSVLAHPVDVEGLSIEVEGTFGAALFPRDGIHAGGLLRRAEMAMHAAKREPAAVVCVYAPHMGEAQKARKAIRGELRRAIETGQFTLDYQPKIAIATGACVGMEALVRWHHPTRGRIGPDQFIPVAERSGLIAPLGAWVMREALRETRAWSGAGLPPLKVAVNVSAVQFLCQDVVEMTEAALAESGMEPRHLEVEITESVIMTDENRVMRQLDGLRALGVSLAIDDFGTGYSSLSYLKRLRVNCLKIDQSFVREMLRDADDVRITRAILNIARDFGLEVVAEGIETAEHAAFFRAEGCHFGQGYYWGRPMPAPEFEAYLRSRESVEVAR